MEVLHSPARKEDKKREKKENRKGEKRDKTNDLLFNVLMRGGT